MLTNGALGRHFCGFHYSGTKLVNVILLQCCFNVWNVECWCSKRFLYKDICKDIYDVAGGGWCSCLSASLFVCICTLNFVENCSHLVLWRLVHPARCLQFSAKKIIIHRHIVNTHSDKTITYLTIIVQIYLSNSKRLKKQGY